MNVPRVVWQRFKNAGLVVGAVQLLYSDYKQQFEQNRKQNQFHEPEHIKPPRIDLEVEDDTQKLQD